MALPNLMDIAIATGNDPLIPLIDETVRAHPELTLVMSKPMKGRRYKTQVRIALGLTTGSFRNANEGTSPIKNRYENREVETFILNPIFQVDKAVADSHEDGPNAYIAQEREGIVEGEMQGLGAQFYYGTGTGGNAKGFPGLLAAYDSTNMVVDAGGTTDNVASSVWAVTTGIKDVMWRWGENGKLELTQPTEALMLDPNDSTKQLPSWYSYLLAYPGLQVGSVQSIGRIKKLTTDSGKGVTDTLIAQLLAKFPAGKKPNVLFMSRRSAMQLQTSRTVVINGGATGQPSGASGNIAPLPTESQGVPIAITDSILDTETLAL